MVVQFTLPLYLKKLCIIEEKKRLNFFGEICGIKKFVNPTKMCFYFLVFLYHL